MEGAQHVFQLELERVRLRAMLAVDRLSAQPDTVARERVGRSLAELEARLARERVGSRAAALAARLGLDDADLDLLWTVVAVAADPRVLPHAVVLGGADARRGASLAVHTLIAELDGDRARELVRRLIGRHPLLDDHLLTWSGEQSAAARPLCAPARTVAWLAGGDQPDPAMSGAGELVVVPPSLELDAGQRAAQALLAEVLATDPPPLVVVEGPHGTGRRTAVAVVARAGGREVMALDLRRLPTDLPTLEAALIGLRRECRLRDALPLVADVDELGDLEEDPAIMLRALVRAIDDMPGPVVITSGRPGLELPSSRPLVRVRWSIPDTATRRALWVATLGSDAQAVGESLDGIAIRYRLGAGGIRRAVTSARLVGGRAPLRASDVVEGVRTNIAERLGDLAFRQEVRQTWDDLVLAPDILDQVKSLTSRVRHAHRVLEEWGFASKLPKGTGVAALFSGPPGTGKTMVAGLIARELDLELYQVDLSKVVSKWVGETEKQLSRIFEAAEAGHALLLFDEADALFAKRTEVKSAVDRYANLEVNYLLQRIESFGGVALLTTNLDASINPALRRRLAATVVFWPPDQHERERLWRRMLTSRAPVASDVNFSVLSGRFPEMTGANIRNAALAAAFLAAGEASIITQAHLERAARGEYASMGRVLRGKPE